VARRETPRKVRYGQAGDRYGIFGGGLDISRYPVANSRQCVT
jgi:hypothetical protein